MASANASSPLLALPRELRDDILGYLTLPQYVYTSTSTKDTYNLYRTRRASGETYVDTRIYLPSRPPTNVLATCRQLRQECLGHHVRNVNFQSPLQTSQESSMSNILAERLGAENAEEAERACDDGVIRITLEVQRQLRGVHGYYIPVREKLSPRFLALLPLMEKARRLRLAIWPGFDWWNGGPQLFVDKRGNTRMNAEQTAKPNAVSVAIGRILEHFPYVEELSIDVLMLASDGGRWDLPDRRWEGVQPWLDSSVMPDPGQLVKIDRSLTGFWKPSEPEPFYTQHEERQPSDNIWKVDRRGDMGTPTMKSYCASEEDHEFLRLLAVEESFVRTD